MSIFALLILVAAFIIAVLEKRSWWVPALIIAGIAVAFVITHGTQVHLH